MKTFKEIYEELSEAKRKGGGFKSRKNRVNKKDPPGAPPPGEAGPPRGSPKMQRKTPKIVKAISITGGGMPPVEEKFDGGRGVTCTMYRWWTRDSHDFGGLEKVSINLTLDPDFGHILAIVPDKGCSKKYAKQVLSDFGNIKGIDQATILPGGRSYPVMPYISYDNHRYA